MIRAGLGWGLLIALASVSSVTLATQHAVPTRAMVYAHYKIELLLVTIIVTLVVLLAHRTWRLKQLAERRAADKSRFLAVMSHEIRTPMNAIMAALQLLAGTQLKPRQSELADVARGAGANLLELLDGVLETERLDQAAVQLQVTATDVNELLVQVVEVHRLSAEAKGLEMQVEITNGVEGALLVDGLRLRQVLGNLLSNAVKFTHNGCIEVHLCVQPDGPSSAELTLTVQDSGIGIPLDRQSALFEPFVQADVSTTRLYGGTGLGLSICKQLVALMGGSIALRSAAGQGSRFTVHCPMLAIGPLPAVQTRYGNVVKAAQGARILVVDDMPLNRRVIGLQLQELGYAFHQACDGEQALRALAEEPWNAVLMDCFLPRMDGYEIVSRWRETEQGAQRRVPIVAISAATDELHHRRCLESGFDAVLGKPLDLDQLSQCLARLCEAAPKEDEPDLVSDELWQLFKATCEDDCTRLAGALQVKDRELAIYHSHRLHGAALVMHQSTLASLSGAYEQQLREGLGWPGAAQRLNEIREVVADLG